MPTFTKRAAIRDALLSLSPRRQDYLGLRRVMMNFILEEIAKRNFDAFQRRKRGGFDEFGQQWVPLRPATVEKKGHRLIGFESGHMEASFRPGYTTRDGYYIPYHPDQIARATAYSVKFGTKAAEIRNGRRRPKADFFHRGTVTQKRRRFWGVNYPKRWVAAGIKNSMPHIAAIIRSRA